MTFIVLILACSDDEVNEGTFHDAYLETSIHLICRVRFINIQAWIRGFTLIYCSVLFSLSYKSQGRFLNKIIFQFYHKASEPWVSIDRSNVTY